MTRIPRIPRNDVYPLRLPLPLLLHCPTCTLRPWRPSDVDALVGHANDFEVARQLRDRFPHPYTGADAVRFIEFAIEEQSGNLAIEVGGEAAGAIGYVPGTDIERFSAEIGYWLGRRFWGRGIATDALRRLTEHLFGEHNLLRLYALPFADNAASMRVLEKAGYEREGLLRSSSVKHGMPRDQWVYARINAEWVREGQAKGNGQ
jgi:[ribosomal protein S5]-alanine N-acetyltransferase